MRDYAVQAPEQHTETLMRSHQLEATIQFQFKHWIMHKWDSISSI